MSLYCIGKLIGMSREDCSALTALVESEKLGISFDVDEGDLEVLEEAPRLRAVGVAFAIHSKPEESDLTTAWLDARGVGSRVLQSIAPEAPHPFSEADLNKMDVPDEVLKSISETPIGRFLSKLILGPGTPAGGIALFDGCIEQIVEFPPQECLRRLLAGFLVPWDCGTDALYVWSHDS
jgi:hypothetical protein